MKKIVLMLLIFTVVFSSCKKEDSKPKQTRLKTYTYEYYARTPVLKEKYTIEYNSANKIAKVIYESNGTIISTKYCVYTSANILDSVIEKYANGSIYAMKIIWTGDKITKYSDISLSYNSNGLIDRKTYSDGDYFRGEYRNDSVFLFFKDSSPSETKSQECKLSSSIKNPFLISGFEKEAYITGVLFYYNNAFNALLPYIETNKIAYHHYGGVWQQVDYTFEGNFNGYPLKRNDLTNSITDNRTKETFTYEEF